MERITKSLILAKIESVYGQNPIPAVATEAMITKGPATFEIVGNPKVRDVPLAHFGKIAPVNVGEAIKVNFTTELKGSGSAGVASRYGCLFRACNMTEGITGGISVAYTPNSTMLGESVTLYVFVDGTRHIVSGCVGSCVIKATAQEIATVDWTFTGMYSGTHATTNSYSNVTHEAIAPLIWKAGGLVYNSISSLVISELTLDLGNTVTKRLNHNAANGIDRYFVSQRDSKGTMTVEKEPLATIDPWTLYNASTQAALSIIPTGWTAGNRFEIAAAGLVLEPPKYADKENVAMWDLAFTMNPTVSTGNNEFVITFK